MVDSYEQKMFLIDYFFGSSLKYGDPLAVVRDDFRGASDSPRRLRFDDLVLPTVSMRAYSLLCKRGTLKHRAARIDQRFQRSDTDG